ncbi:helix-turn-helix transcriptional regulator [Actinophytocola sp. NPDC049390]|uniref:helix-turn-helix transcriptional regulator n=1 Tax=Actinophytocola sp. NPDC049390 TaxID=3363894 RepID=UPI0037BB611F
MGHSRWCYCGGVTGDPAIRAVAALDDDLRRGMYAFIRAARRPVTRDEAAAAVGISRKLAAFHLDKLVDAGVLQADYRQVAGMRRVGRAPKVYRPADTDISVSIPPRKHDLLAEILLDAATRDDPDAVRKAAYDHGHRVGADERARSRPGRLGTERALTLVAATMRRHGFEPVREPDTSVRLRTCPFHPMAATSPALVCGINHAFLSGLLDGLDAPTLTAELAPGGGECCVELHGRFPREP